MFGIQEIGLTVARAIQCDRGGWYPWEFSELSPDGSKLKASPVTSPVLHRGLLYLLGIDGRLAVHDDRRHEEGFLVLDKPGGFGPDRDADECYLFESDEGELRAVLVGRRGEPVGVVRLDEREMEWEEVESLGGRAVLTGTAATMMMETGVEWMRNRVFVPRLYSWPETIHANLMERGGELAFVPVSAAAVARDGGAGEKGIWSCGWDPEQSEKFWETIKFYQGIWVNFRK
ncbi:hypothetical protein PAHAL_2G253400 [Panicum hallii]|jgi:hypothetical protein|uniref:KIB1-4 beta-propeller domain-containing protein n=1 Tax=Panicum hallii TaxID=206008 RepID=A0A2T8KQF8_9POAL|nr:uncharacterized protein LOC112881928 [Panicum hallii]PVH64380.1 hypothetical protein PAHAL_2G253400 [Panicum hallii]